MRGSLKCSTEDGIRSGAGWREALSSILSTSLLMFVGAYRTLGTNHLGGCCRFEPSCSEYAVEAIHAHNPFKAFRLILIRVAKCRPGSAWGYDPVPRSGAS